MTTIISYNMKFGGKGRVQWKAILDHFAPSVLLVQESYPPWEHLPEHESVATQSAWAPAVNSKRSMKWGSGVYLPAGTLTPIHFADFPGWVVGAEVERWKGSPAGGSKTRFFSIHAPRHLGTYQKAVNLILDRLLDFRDGCELVIGGDFNISVSERLDSEERCTSSADHKIQLRLRDEFGLVNCWQTMNPNQPLAQTLRWVSQPTVPYHCDGIFVPSLWLDSMQSSQVITGGLWDTLSDHNPVIAKMSLPDGPPQT